MFKLKKLKLNKINKFFKKCLRVTGENPFLASLALILLSLIIGTFVFYNYSIQVQEKKPETISKPLLLEEKGIREILKIWETRQNNFEQADFRTFPNPFTPTP